MPLLVAIVGHRLGLPLALAARRNTVRDVPGRRQSAGCNVEATSGGFKDTDGYIRVQPGIRSWRFARGVYPASVDSRGQAVATLAVDLVDRTCRDAGNDTAALSVGGAPARCRSVERLQMVHRLAACPRSARRFHARWPDPADCSRRAGIAEYRALRRQPTLRGSRRPKRWDGRRRRRDPTPPISNRSKRNGDAVKAARRDASQRRLHHRQLEALLPSPLLRAIS
jgi:hypothetical protein